MGQLDDALVTKNHPTRMLVIVYESLSSDAMPKIV